METVWQFLKKLNAELPYYTVIPLLDMYPKELKQEFQQVCVWTPTFLASLVTIVSSICPLLSTPSCFLHPISPWISSFIFFKFHVIELTQMGLSIKGNFLVPANSILPDAQAKIPGISLDSFLSLMPHIRPIST